MATIKPVTDNKHLRRDHQPHTTPTPLKYNTVEYEESSRGDGHEDGLSTAASISIGVYTNNMGGQ